MFWKWVSASTLALVTATAVLHWAMDGDAAPTKVIAPHHTHTLLMCCSCRCWFCRRCLIVMPTLLLVKSSTIALIQRNNGCTFCFFRCFDFTLFNFFILCSCLVGISQKDGRVAGSMQLYSVQRKVSQSIEVSLVSIGNNTVFSRSISTILFFVNRVMHQHLVHSLLMEPVVHRHCLHLLCALPPLPNVRCCCFFKKNRIRLLLIFVNNCNHSVYFGSGKRHQQSIPKEGSGSRVPARGCRRLSCRCASRSKVNYIYYYCC